MGRLRTIIECAGAAESHSAPGIKEETEVGISIPLTLCLSMVSLNPIEDLPTDHVDLVELNHYYNEKGRHVLDQVIFYDWSSAAGRYQIRDWRMIKRVSQIPRREWRLGGYVAVWHDPLEGNVLRKMHAASLRETWTQYDPEIVERSFLKKDKRRKLARVRSSRRTR